MSPPALPSADDLVRAVTSWLAGRRWFPGDDHSKILAGQCTARRVGEDMCIDLVVLVDQVRLNVPLVLTPGEPSAGVITRFEGQWVVDGPMHSAWWQNWRDQARRVPGCEREPGALVPAGSRMRLVGAEQSNSSFIIEGPAGPLVLKVYRTLSAGEHPDLHLGAALAGSGWTHVATPLACTHLRLDDGEALSSLLTPLVPGAVDAFAHFIDGASRGRDCRGQAQELGSVTRQMHVRLAEVLGTADPILPQELAGRVHGEIDRTRAEVPLLDADLARRLHMCVEPLGRLDRMPLPQRVHGDYHLGQVLLSSDAARWYVLDFEGEPLRPLEERSRPDLALRDVAGMLRSFGYARALGQRQARQADSPIDEGAACTWERQCVRAFLHGWSGGRGLDATEQAVLDSLVVEKACYELRYEASMRPTWTDIPLHALEEIAGGRTPEGPGRTAQ
ncbi:phosphotransferase [Schaalia sp. 19OD2882]|uniref:phosphotransferase n=1 Tax=Schaalia sp. 19OD2882 TaxID=2794089 RepID=UPI001C1F1649|nr:phosphotransferase [Schaalia sp. 19OD2882]QWW20371.1 phosphotransferase [Schaalia sp. 19OD2882]